MATAPVDLPANVVGLDRGQRPVLAPSSRLRTSLSDHPLARRSLSFYDAPMGGVTAAAITHCGGMGNAKRRRSRRADPDPPSADNDDTARRPARRGRPPKLDLRTWRVVDDWPEVVPVTLEEVAVYERWFGDVLEALFGPDAAEETSEDPLAGSGPACRHLERK